MKKRVLIIVFGLLVTCVYGQGEETKITYNKDGIKGYVYFEGFDFKGYKPETDGIESMLKSTLTELQSNYKASKQPFVFVGHSQGGLRALAMSSYLKENDKDLYKQLRGVITLSGIDTGLLLLENRGATFRSKLQNDVSILSNGVTATIKAPGTLVLNPDILTNYLFNELFKAGNSSALYGLGRKILCDCMGGSESYAYPILYNKNWNDYAQVRDMCPQSDFIKKWVLDGSTLKLDRNLKYHFIIGEKADSIEAAYEYIDNPEGIKKGLSNSAKVFTAARAAHIAKTATGLGLFTNSIKYASDCKKAADWCNNYQSELNDLIGQSVNDGLVAKNSQYISALESKPEENANVTHNSISTNPTITANVKNTVIQWLK